MPMLACTPRVNHRLDTVLDGRRAAMASWAAPTPSSKAIARSITGSTKIRAKTNASTPAEGAGHKAAPDDLLFHRVGYSRASVAGEAEEVPSVVHELVHVGVVTEDRRRALVHPDEVEDQISARKAVNVEPHRRLGHRQVELRALARLAAPLERSCYVPFGISRPSFQGDDGRRV